MSCIFFVKMIYNNQIFKGEMIMNDEKEKFRASLKVILGGNGKNTSIDIPLEDNKE